MKYDHDNSVQIPFQMPWQSGSMVVKHCLSIRSVTSSTWYILVLAMITTNLGLMQLQGIFHNENDKFLPLALILDPPLYIYFAYKGCEGGGGTCPLCPLPESAYELSLNQVIHAHVK